MSNLKMSDGKPAHIVVEMRGGKYIDVNGIEHIQSTQYPCRKQKGVKHILIERGNKHKNDKGHVLFLQCNWCKGEVTDDDRRIGSKVTSTQNVAQATFWPMNLIFWRRRNG